MDYSQFSDYTFAQPIPVFVEDKAGRPLMKTLITMGDYLALYDEIRQGDVVGKFGDFTVEQQLWMSLAIYSFFLRSPESQH